MRTLWLVVLLVCGVIAVSAHQLKTASTTVLFNERSGNIEVVHRFFLHDAEHAVKQLFDKNADIHQLDATRRHFSDYVQQHFALQTLDNQALALKHVGFEIEGNNFWVYQEMPMVEGINGLRIRHKALQNIWHNQQNLVNVEGHGPLQSVTFKAEDDWLEVRF